VAIAVTAMRELLMSLGVPRVICLATVAFAGLAMPAPAQKVDFSGQKITLAIATPPGGGYDLYGRLAGRFLGAYLPGNPTIVSQNMPGAGSPNAANWLYNVAPRDGSAIGIIPSATAFENFRMVAIPDGTRDP
jgi:tripartite-type tricarboxylate transporter receptor subunit TctC